METPRRSHRSNPNSLPCPSGRCQIDALTHQLEAESAAAAPPAREPGALPSASCHRPRVASRGRCGSPGDPGERGTGGAWAGWARPTSPVSCARTTAWTRSRRSSLARMCRTWLLTVASEMNRSWAISSFDLPLPTRASTSSSRALNAPARPETVGSERGRAGPVPPGTGPARRATCSDHLVILVTRPAPTVRPPSRIAKRRPSSIAIGWISLTDISVLSPGMTISVPSGSSTTPVTSVVRK